VIDRFPARLPRRLPRAVAIMLLAAVTLSGCVAMHLVGALAQNAEYQKKLEVLPKYDDLPGHRVAVVVDADLATLYDHPELVTHLTGGIAVRIAAFVPNVSMLSPDRVIAWQYQTPMWNAMSYGDIAKSLDVDRVVYVDVYEYRLNPPGNRFLWEGLCAANVKVIERDYIDPDSFTDAFEVTAEYPKVKNLDVQSEAESKIQQGLLYSFVERVSWLFYTHEEPKYPDKYRPELDSGNSKT
jgi:hypothetical protein